MDLRLRVEAGEAQQHPRRRVLDRQLDLLLVQPARLAAALADPLDDGDTAQAEDPEDELEALVVVGDGFGAHRLQLEVVEHFDRALFDWIELRHVPYTAPRSRFLTPDGPFSLIFLKIRCIATSTVPRFIPCRSAISVGERSRTKRSRASLRSRSLRPSR